MQGNIRVDGSMQFGVHLFDLILLQQAEVDDYLSADVASRTVLFPRDGKGQDCRRKRHEVQLKRGDVGRQEDSR